MPAISADDHHSAVNPHKTVQRLLALALECYFPIIAFTSATHFCSRSAFSKDQYREAVMGREQPMRQRLGRGNRVASSVLAA
jgi:hypothetical protein